MRWIERIEYGLILALIAIVVIGILTLLISNLGG
jgi:Flp pilus assembly pilin Flp